MTFLHCPLRVTEILEINDLLGFYLEKLKTWDSNSTKKNYRWLKGHFFVQILTIKMIVSRPP